MCQQEWWCNDSKRTIGRNMSIRTLFAGDTLATCIITSSVSFPRHETQHNKVSLQGRSLIRVICGGNGIVIAMEWNPVEIMTRTNILQKRWIYYCYNENINLNYLYFQPTLCVGNSNGQLSIVTQLCFNIDNRIRTFFVMSFKLSGRWTIETALWG